MTIRYSPGAVRSALTPVDNRFLLDYMPHADGIAVKVYLYGLLLCAFPGAGDANAADALGLSEADVTNAFRYWQAQGLVHISSDEPLTVEYLAMPQTEGAPQIPGRYHKLVTALNVLTAPRQFDVRELRHVYDWVEVFGLDEDAALELVSHCMDIKGRRVSVNYMDTVARSWASEGIRTRDAALRYLEAYRIQKHGAAQILQEWNKRRKPTKTEMALYDKWTGEWGFSQDAIAQVLPRVGSAGTPSFDLLDRILSDLYREKRTAPETIRLGDAEEESERLFARLLFERAGKIEPASRTQRAQIHMYLVDYGMPRELLLYGAERSRGANEPFGKMKKLWNDWRAAGADTVEKAEAYETEQAPSAQKSGGRARRSPYAQHDLNPDQLDALLTDLDKEL